MILESEQANEIEQVIKQLKRDPRNSSYSSKGIGPVFQADPQARILIIGQAPGRKVEETGIPFNDKSGETLMQWMGITADTFYSPAIAIVPMDFYYPGKGKSGDKPPRRFIAQEYHERILAAMDNVQLTILIGSYAMKYYLKDRMKENLTETVRNYEEYLPAYFPIVHPSPLNFRWQKKNPWFLEEVVPRLQKEVAACLQDDR